MMAELESTQECSDGQLALFEVVAALLGVTSMRNVLLGPTLVHNHAQLVTLAMPRPDIQLFEFKATAPGA